VTPPRKRKSNTLTSIGGLIREGARIYRAAKKGRIPHEEARSLVWILAQQRQLIETQQMEQIHTRIHELNGQAQVIEHGGEIGNPRAIAAH
jgi:hypothetical protein